MLVLARKLNEALRVGEEVRITVVEIRSGRVRLGIDAPRHVRIHREEAARRDPEGMIEFEIAVAGIAE
ncbi:MAG TPA: carbon storage regulator [Planctomycetaceae bacterium]|jgi:carbon storage regulator CsrA|nr:carbon storage regulator [Planctomycetaceae bacterium]